MMHKLSERLSAVASLVKKGSRIVDVGTDHGYIPVFLVKSGVTKTAIACDINSDPLSSCIRLIENEGVEDKISPRLSNGLENVYDNEIDTIIIAGMGGELIAEILSNCSYISDKHIILNPMTHPEVARKFLYDNGFEIDNDFIVKDGKHYYSVFDAHYTGNFSKKSLTDYFLGNIKDFTQTEYFKHLLNYLNQKAKSGADYSDVITAVEKKIYDNC